MRIGNKLLATAFAITALTSTAQAVSVGGRSGGPVSTGIGSSTNTLGIGYDNNTGAGMNSQQLNTLNTSSGTSTSQPTTNGSSTGLDLSDDPNQPQHNRTGRADNPVANTTAANGVSSNTSTGVTASTPVGSTSLNANASTANSIKVRRGTQTNTTTPTLGNFNNSTSINGSTQ